MLGELIEFLVDEMAMDGEEGCSLARLDVFISTFADRHHAKNPSFPRLKLDDAFKDFIWRQLVSLSTIRVGVLERAAPPDPSGPPEALTSKDQGVDADGVTPQPDAPATPKDIPTGLRGKVNSAIAKRAAAKKAKEPTWNWRELGEDEKKEGRAVLATRYAAVEASGPEDGRLRIGANPQTCMRAMIGSDHAHPRITPFVYEILCLITRGREDGATVVELGKQTPHDQKSVYYFVSVLQDLELVEKFQVSISKARTNRVIHRRYLATSKHWKAFTQSEGSEPHQMHAQPEAGGGGGEAIGRPMIEDGDGDESLAVGPADVSKMPKYPAIESPINNINEAVLKARVEQALRCCVGQTIQHAELIRAVGMPNPTKEDRRRMNRLIDIWAEEGLIEKIWIAGMRSNTACVRLVKKDPPIEAERSSNRSEAEPWNQPEGEAAQHAFVPLFAPLTRRIFEIIEEAGEDGTTYKDILPRMAHYNPRAIEQCLLQHDTQISYRHLSDLRVRSVTEQVGKEKRIRWFTVPNLRKYCDKHSLPYPEDTDVYPEAGGFDPVDYRFYNSIEELDEFHEAIHSGKVETDRRKKAKTPAKERGTKKGMPGQGRPRKYPYGTTSKEASHLRKKLAQGLDITADVKALEDKYGNMSREEWLVYTKDKRTKGKGADNGETPDGAPDTPSGQPASRARKRKRIEMVEEAKGEGGVGMEKTVPPPPKKKGGRPRKSTTVVGATPTHQSAQHEVEVEETAPPPPKTKRGRPRKSSTIVDVTPTHQPAPAEGLSAQPVQTSQPELAPQTPAPTPKRRGRPPKLKSASTSQPSAPATPGVQYVIPKKRGRPSKADLAKRAELARASEVASMPQQMPASEPEGLSLTEHTEVIDLDDNLPPPPSQVGHQQPQLDTSSLPVTPAERPTQRKKRRRVEIVEPDKMDFDEAPAHRLLGTGDDEQAPTQEPANWTQTPSAESASRAQTPATRISTGKGKENEGTPPGEAPKTPGPTKAAALMNSSRRRTNLTSVHRANDILDLVRSMGGVVERSRELARAYQERVAATNPGPASSQTTADRRTVDSAIAALERQGSIKRVTVSLPDALHRQTRREVLVASDLALDSPQVTNYLKELEGKLISAEAATWRGRRTLPVGTPFQPAKSSATPAPQQLDPGAEWSDESVREMMSTERYVAPQYNGWLVGIIARARTLHLQLLNLFSDPHRPESSNILSKAPDEPRIFLSALFVQDISVRAYVSIVQLLGIVSEYEAFRNEPGALDAPVHAAPASIKSFLKLGTTYARNKLMNVVQRLCQLGLVIPLEPTTEITEHYVPTAGSEPSYFRRRDFEKPVSYFRLASSCKIYHPRRDEGKVERALLRTAQLPDAAAGERYWDYLKKASSQAPPEPDPDCAGQTYSGEHLKVFIELTGLHTWSATPTLFPTQQTFLRLLLSRLEDPKNAANDPEQVARLAHTVLSEPHLVKDFCSGRLLADEQRRRKMREIARRKRAQVGGPAEGDFAPPTAEEVAELLAEKVKGAGAQREKDFRATVARFKVVHKVDTIDEALLDNLHKRFTSSSNPITVRDVEQRLTAALQTPGEEGAASRRAVGKDAAAAAELKRKLTRVLKPKKRDRRAERQATIVKQAIQVQQGVQPGARPSLVGEGKHRKHFNWDANNEDFLRDAIAIMRARAIAVGRKTGSWSIVFQIFGMKSQAVRSHGNRLSAMPNEQKYLDLLTAAWSEVYEAQMFPDDPKGKTDDIDVGKALDLLRANIDKNYLWFQAEAPPGPADAVVLPRDLSDLQRTYDVTLQQPMSFGDKRWDFVHQNVNLKARLSEFSNQAISVAVTSDEHDARPESDDLLRATEMLKMVLITSEETFESEPAERLLQPFADVAPQAMEHLIQRDVVALRHNSSNEGQDRKYRFSDRFLAKFDRFGGEDESKRKELFKETFQAEDLDQEQEWPLIPTDQEMVALIEGFSAGVVDIDVDTSAFEELRRDGDFLSRRVGDDITEHTVNVALRRPLVAKAPPAEEPPDVEEEKVDEVEVVIKAAGTTGITPNALTEALAGSMTSSEVATAVARLVDSSPPAVFWAGTNTRVIVDAAHLSSWCAKTKPEAAEDHEAFTYPRIWKDVFGETEAGMLGRAKGVVQRIVERQPGISEGSLQKQTKAMLTAVEVDDIVASLLDEDKVSTAAPGLATQPHWQRGFGRAHFWPV